MVGGGGEGAENAGLDIDDLDNAWLENGRHYIGRLVASSWETSKQDVACYNRLADPSVLVRMPPVDTI